jgi:hypothetical protein
MSSECRRSIAPAAAAAAWLCLFGAPAPAAEPETAPAAQQPRVEPPQGEAAKPSAEAPPPSAPAPSPPVASPAPVPPPPVSAVLSKDEVQGLLGKEVMSSAGEDMGRIVDVVVDKSGDLRAAIIDFGGFLGVGSRKIAVDRSALRFDSESKTKRVITELSRNQVKDAPEYKEGKPVVVLGAAGTQPMAPDDSAVQRE